MQGLKVNDITKEFCFISQDALDQVIRFMIDGCTIKRSLIRQFNHLLSVVGIIGLVI